MMFIDDIVIPNGYAVVEDEQINGKLLPIPYAEEVSITIVEANGKGKSFEYTIAEGEVIISGWNGSKRWISLPVCVLILLCVAAISTGGWDHQIQHLREQLFLPRAF